MGVIPKRPLIRPKNPPPSGGSNVTGGQAYMSLLGPSSNPDDARIYGASETLNQLRLVQDALKFERAKSARIQMELTSAQAERDRHKSREEAYHRGMENTKEQKQQLEMELARLKTSTLTEIIDNHDVTRANENEYLLVSDKWIGKIRADNDSKDIEVRQWRIVAAIAFAAGFAIASIVLSSL